jgi:hypothetical protein
VPVELTGRVGNGRMRKALGRFYAGVLIGVIGNLVYNTIPHDLNWFHSNHFKNKKESSLQHKTCPSDHSGFFTIMSREHEAIATSHLTLDT